MDDQPESSNPLADVHDRVRLLESKYSIMRDRVFMINQNMVDEYKRLMQELKEINIDLKEIKREIFTMRETVKDVVEEMSFFARKENLKVLERYINMWNPLNYVTEEELEKILEEKLKHKHKAKRG